MKFFRRTPRISRARVKLRLKPKIKAKAKAIKKVAPKKAKSKLSRIKKMMPGTGALGDIGTMMAANVASTVASELISKKMNGEGVGRRKKRLRGGGASLKEWSDEIYKAFGNNWLPW